MKHFAALTIQAVIMYLLLAFSAEAQIMDQAVTTGIGASTELGAAAQPKADRSVVAQRLGAQGYTDLSSVDGKDVFATSPDGQRVKLLIDPTTGGIMGAVPQ